MKTKLMISAVMSVIVLFLALVLTYQRLRFMKLEKIRYETNYEALKLEEGSKALVERVIKSEFKAMFPELEKIAKESGIKIKNIETVHNVHYKTVWDTIPVEVDLQIDPLDDQQLMFLESKNCIDVEGYIDFNLSPIVLTSNNKKGIDLLFTRVEQNDTITTFYFWERKLKKIIFVKLKIGRKQFWSESHSVCKAELRTEAIRITRKGKR